MSAPPQARFSVFFSCAADGDAARQAIEESIRERWPAIRFLSGPPTDPGSSWHQALLDAFEAADAVIVLVTAAFLKLLSDHRPLAERIATALPPRKVLAVLVGDCDWPGSLAASFPFFDGAELPFDRRTPAQRASLVQSLAEEVGRRLALGPDASPSVSATATPASRRNKWRPAFPGTEALAPAPMTAPRESALQRQPTARDLLTDLSDAAFSPGFRVFGLSGAPGSGKSLWTASLANSPQIAAAYPDGVYYVVASSESIRETVLELARDLDLLPDSRDTGLFQRLSELRALLIVDDVDRNGDIGPVVESLRSGPLTLLLVATEPVLLERTGALVYEIPEWKRDETPSGTVRRRRRSAREKAPDMTVGDARSSFSWLTEADLAAFRAAGALAQAESRPVNGRDLLLGYLFTAAEEESDAQRQARPECALASLALELWQAESGTQPPSPSHLSEVLPHPFGGRVRSVARMAVADVRYQANAPVSEGLRTMLMRGSLLADAAGATDAHRLGLLVCLLGPETWELDPAGAPTTIFLPYPAERLRKGFYAWIVRNGLVRNAEPLRRILGLPEPGGDAAPDYVPGTAGYAAEYCGIGSPMTVDHLNVQGDANRLADLIALRETRLPLAIGLFANWGKGKSHFMNLMNMRIEARTGEERQKPPGSPPQWCREVVVVHFNAWHYLDSDLWASMVAQIFEALFARLRDKPDEMQLVTERLRHAQGVTARATKDAVEAARVAQAAERALEKAREKTAARQSTVEGLTDGLQALLKGESKQVAEIEKRAAAVLGVEAVTTLQQLQEIIDTSRTLHGMAKVAWANLWEPRGRTMRLALAGAAILLGLSRELLDSLPFPFLRHVHQWLHPVAMPVAAAIALIGPYLLKTARFLGKIQKLTDEAERARRATLGNDQHKAAKKALEQAKDAQRALEKEAAKAREEEESILSEIEMLQPERKLARFIENRAGSSDYRNRLGLVSLARRDFQELSDLFATSETAPAGAGGAPPGKSINRIVLFIDDLDRCGPERVVDVLQAVHLLLAFPLFAVVVGVDQRCLRRSLKLQLEGLVSDGKAAPDAPPDAAHEHAPATPLDYLEKIFHVPFHLPEMTEAGFGALMDKLTEPPASATDPARVGRPTVVLEAKAKEGTAAAVVKPVPIPPLPAPPQPAASPDGAKVAAAPAASGTVGSVSLIAWEREALKQYHRLIATPRGAKRFLNTYRLVRAGIPQAEWASFHIGGEHLVAMLLLAAAAGHPACARTWFGAIRKNSAALRSGVEPSPGGRALHDAFTETLGARDNFGQATWNAWLDRVEKFTF